MAVLENLRRRNDPMNTKPEPRMPRITNVLPPIEYDDEVLRVAHKQIEATRAIAALQAEVDNWRRQALDAQVEVNRLEARLQQERAEHDETSKSERAGHDDIVGKLMEDRDYWKGETIRVKTCAQNGATVFLQILEEGKRRAPGEADKVGLAAVADELVKEALPHVVVAGPRDYPQKDEPTGGAS